MQLRFLGRSVLLAVCLSLPTSIGFAQKIQTPGKIQEPKPADQWQKPGEIQKPKPADQWQVPGEIQKPGEIQTPRGIQAIKSQKAQCQQRLIVGSDALFEFDKATLTAKAEETLQALGPMLKQTGQHPVHLEGHTDSVGADDYNLRLSERRAQAVKDWLVAKGYLSSAATLKGFGETRPVAPNAKSNGTDDPFGRQKNRRVEVVIDTCH